MMNQPLKGVRVVDFTAYGAGPAAGKVLADWGADVIKIEPLDGDPSRSTSKTLGMRADEGQNPHWELINANKRSLPLNLKTEEGKMIMDKLLSESNIFISNYRFKALLKMGLDYETMAAKHPHIIWGHLSGFGMQGPLVDNPGFDTVAYWARSGAMIDFCENGEYPLTPPFGLGDLAIASTFAGSVASCLYQQAKTGKGEKVMTSLYGMGIWATACLVQSTYHGDKLPKSRFKPDSPLRNTVKCADGIWLMISVIVYDRYFPVMCKLIGREDLINDPRFNTEAAVRENSEEFTKIIDAAFIQKDSVTWDKILTEADIAHDRINHVKDVHTDEQALANNFIYMYKGRDGEEDLTVATPVKFGNSDAADHRNAPLLGEHTKEVLAQLGYGSSEIDGFVTKGATKTL
ncbi:MAG: CaiB/BaiF CoA transferase family protein [Anaerofustis sp.]